MIRVGLIASSFDLLHAGHVHFIRTAAENCDRLICALQTDITDRPDKNRPVQTVYERFLQLQAVKGVDRIIPYQSEDDLYNLLVTTPHHLRFLGEEYMGKEITGFNLYEAYAEIKDLPAKQYPCIVYVPRLHDYSSTSLRNRVYAAR